jgi:hypothetical protein
MCRLSKPICIIIAAFSISISAFAQEEQAGSDSGSGLAGIRESVQAFRRELISEEMFLTDEEASVFWPIYDEYRQEVSVVGDRYAKLITTFANLYNEGQITSEDAEAFVDGHMEIEAAFQQIKKDYVHRLREVMSPFKVTRFYQIESKMDAESEAQLALAIPLVDPE